MINVNHKYIGIEYMDVQYNKNTVESFSEKHNAYLVKPEGIPCHNIVPESEIEFFLNKQDKIIECKIKSEQRAKAEQDKKEQEEKEYNNVNGFCDNMSAMQKGKVLKVLNKEFRHKGKTITRKQFIYNLINDGYSLRIIENMLSSSRKIQGERIEKYRANVPAIEKDGFFYEITKTEYDYALYLIKNK